MDGCRVYLGRRAPRNRAIARPVWRGVRGVPGGPIAMQRFSAATWSPAGRPRLRKPMHPSASSWCVHHPVTPPLFSARCVNHRVALSASHRSRAWPERQEPIATANSRALATTASRSNSHEKSPAVSSPTGLSCWPRRASGSDCRTRTCDPAVNSRLLYQLS
jgi:hypothetical protein